MRWVTLPSIGSRIATAAAVSALVAIPALSVPAPTFALPAPPANPSCTDANSLSCLYSDPPTDSDDPRCIDTPTAGECVYSPWNSTDD